MKIALENFDRNKYLFESEIVRFKQEVDRRKNLDNLFPCIKKKIQG
jgi:hypothetical protein